MLYSVISHFLDTNEVITFIGRRSDELVHPVRQIDRFAAGTIEAKRNKG
ncbi:hypothetical protein SZ54_4912 [Rhizobium sp. UR51a]|nr:hypothetical protein SZ54_4912 [Rhizobium sp. UR51a]